jgi:hypothetical protein
MRLKLKRLDGMTVAGGSCQGRAVPRCHCCGGGVAAGAGLEAGGGDVILLVTHLEPEVAEAALQYGVGAVIKGQEWWHVAAAADPDAFGGPQLLGQVLWSLPICSVLPGHRREGAL